MKNTNLPHKHKIIDTADLPRQIHTAATSCPTDTISNDSSGKTMDAGEMLKDTGEQPSLSTKILTYGKTADEREMKFVINPLEDEMRKRGATHKLIGDRTHAEEKIRKKVATRSFVISDHGFPSESTKTVVSFIPEDDPPEDVPQESNKAHNSPSHYSPKQPPINSPYPSVVLVTNKSIQPNPVKIEMFCTGRDRATALMNGEPGENKRAHDERCKIRSPLSPS